MDLHRDFVSDPQCDYYEKDPNCVANAPGTRPSYWNQPSRPSQSYGPSYGSPNEKPDTRPYALDQRPLEEVPRPLNYDRRPLEKEIPRPLDFDRRPTNEIPRPLDYGAADHNRWPPMIYGHPHHGQYDDTFDRRSYSNNQGQTGYSGTRSEDSFGYSDRHPSRRPVNDDFYNRNLPRYPKYPNRRIEHGPTHDIGTNEIGPYLPDHRKDPTRDWGTYGNVYGGSYGYDTNYVGKFDVPKYYPKLPPPPPPPPPRPYENDHFYGDFYNYGGAFGYGDNYIPANQDPLYGDTGKTTECSVRAGAGFKLSRGVVRKTYLTANLDQCESLCVNEKSYVCMSFSYRYNVAPTDPTDNCLLSDVSYKDLNFYIDLEPDRDYDIYAMITNSRTCGTKREPSPHPPDECFWRVRSGFGMPTDVVRKSIIVNNLGECQAACTLAQDFTCRSFAFKYGLEQGRSDVPTNCYLSDWPSQDINPAHMPDMDGAELYEKGSFGRGCEPYAVPFFNTEQFNSKQSPQGTDEVCYSGYNKPCKLTPYAVLLATYVNSEQDCREKCSRMRETDSIPCMSYSYKLTTHGTEENCLLSDVPIRDLRPGLDYIYDKNHVLYAWKDLDPYCVITGSSIDDDHVFGGPSLLRPLGPARPDFSPGAGYPSMRPDDMYPDTKPYFKPGGYHHGAIPFDPDKPDPIRPHRPGGSYGDQFGGIRPGGFGSLYPDESTFRYYTVNGYPCKKGTKCEKNKIAGFWTCEPEGGEYGSWDYCCAPTHHCGFSQGYQYPWYIFL
ncbi:ras-related protein [Lasius niger]|uniref:Ras-related protein n=1 Tax=Lasius niger TaxID=67767 RepID=A0A0J7KUZ9_LASNI|nr:ras-related protein [Lasius niger]